MVRGSMVWVGLSKTQKESPVEAGFCLKMKRRCEIHTKIQVEKVRDGGGGKGNEKLVASFRQ